MQQGLKEAELTQKEQANIRDNETKLLIAEIQSDNDSVVEDGYDP